MKTRLTLFLFFIGSISVLSQEKPEILADKYLLQAKDCIDKNDNPCAIDFFKKILALNLEVPDELYYFYGQTLFNNGDDFKAEEMINKYIDKAGQQGLYYMQALKLSIELEKNNYFIDPRDNKKYKIVKIGSQTWFAENLNYEIENSWCNYDSISNCNLYGRLYTLDAAKAACPAGWHLPSDEEWSQLTDYLGGENIAGGKMKNTTLWDNPNTGATNSSGFSAIPGGDCLFCADANNKYIGYEGIGIAGVWWSSTEITATIRSAYYRVLYYSNGRIARSDAFYDSAYSVRCVKDE